MILDSLNIGHSIKKYCSFSTAPAEYSPRETTVILSLSNTKHIQLNKINIKKYTLNLFYSPAFY